MDEVLQLPNKINLDIGNKLLVFEDLHRQSKGSTALATTPVKKAMAMLTKSLQESCKYSPRKCSHPCVEGYGYCLSHILEDKTAPYKPCSYIYSITGKKCNQPALKTDRREVGMCEDHFRKAHVQRQKSSGKHIPPQTTESLLASLSHYTRSTKIEENKSASSQEDNETVDISQTLSQPTKALNPFVETDAYKVNAKGSLVLDYASESDSDVEPSMLDNVWRAQDQESSDAESVDSQLEDPLKHAAIYTAEEVTKISRDKLIRLQSLYIEQFRRLQHILKERRRKYLHSLKKEKETLCSIHNQSHTTPKEQKLYEKLKALNRFHKRNGIEAVLHKKALERRAEVTEGVMIRVSHKGKCIFTEGGVKCGAKTLPVTKYCKKHIFEDTQQLLYRHCGVQKADLVCQEPTLTVFENTTCIYHVPIPPQPHTINDKNIKIEDRMKEDQAHKDKIKSIETALDVTIPESQTDEIDSAMEVEETPIEEKQPISTLEVETEDVSRPHNVSESPNDEDLVMDDIMADVDVVEEVLETDGTMQKDMSDDVQLDLREIEGGVLEAMDNRLEENYKNVATFLYKIPPKKRKCRVFKCRKRNGLKI